MFLDAGARRACSAWSFVEAHVQPRLEDHLGGDLGDGRWDARYGGLRSQPSYDGSLRLVIGRA